MMKNIFAVSTILVSVLFTVGPGIAHLRSERTFVAVQVPINTSEFQNIKVDGDLSEWANVPDLLWVTHADLIETVRGLGDPDSSNLAERIIVGWSPVTNLIYTMEDRYDDVSLYFTSETIYEMLEWVIDADHSGGRYQVMQDLDLDPDRNNSSQAQNYHYFLKRKDPIWFWGAASWPGLPPYAHISWTFEGEMGGPGTLNVETYFMGFDDIDFRSVDDSIIHTYEEGAIIGVGFAVIDTDKSEVDGYNGFWTNSGATRLDRHADNFVDYLLAPFDPNIWVPAGTAVDRDTPGRVKSTLSE